MRNSISDRFFYIGILFCFTLVIKAQNIVVPEVELSNQKVMIGGKTYFLHTVKKGQTLFSIARAYKCTVNEILQENPNLTEEIKVDQIIKIPFKEKISEVTGKSNEVIHTVMPGQTLFSIARMYGVSVSDIKTTNQLTSDTLKVSQQLIIPVYKTLSETTPSNIPSAVTSSQYIIHRVQEGETLFSLAKKYGTTVEKIIALNPEQREAIKIGSDLKIPTENITTFSCDSLTFSIKDKSFIISLLLPFFADKTEQMSEEEENQDFPHNLKKTDDNFPPVVMNFIEFYQGILLAVEDMKKEGLNIELNVYDTGKGLDKIKNIISLPAFQKSNLILGPVFSEQIPIVADFSRKTHIPVVLPVTSIDSFEQQTPELFQVFSGPKGEIEQLISTLSSDSIRNILVVYNGKENQQLNQQVRNLLSSTQKFSSKSIKEFYVYNYDFKDLLAQLDSTTTNHVVSFSTDEVFVASLLGQLETRLLYYPIRTYGRSEWLAFNSVDINYFYNQQLTCFSNFYVDYEKEKVLKFLKKYRLRFSTEPIRNSKYGFNYCMLGYDLAQYFAIAWVNAGRNFAAYNCVPYQSLNIKIKFFPSSTTGGYVNKAFYRIRFNRNFDFTVE
ncbi:MAG: LysM peptidoglycan-binding domain-containing protein [Bacteroidales bacterium]|nr:LysM peptidoglycan-binding domain-containing protein [Bacteroidales bacterium]